MVLLNDPAGDPAQHAILLEFDPVHGRWRRPSRMTRLVRRPRANLTGWLTGVMVGDLLLFGIVFATNGALHSYLTLAVTKAARVTTDVGFYYMSNAAGRLLGTLLSGVSCQAAPSWACAGGLGRLPGSGVEVRAGS